MVEIEPANSFTASRRDRFFRLTRFRQLQVGIGRLRALPAGQLDLDLDLDLTQPEPERRPCACMGSRARPGTRAAVVGVDGVGVRPLRLLLLAPVRERDRARS